MKIKFSSVRLFFYTLIKDDFWKKGFSFAHLSQCYFLFLKKGDKNRVQGCSVIMITFLRSHRLLLAEWHVFNSEVIKEELLKICHLVHTLQWTFCVGQK